MPPLPCEQEEGFSAQCTAWCLVDYTKDRPIFTTQCESQEECVSSGVEKACPLSSLGPMLFHGFVPCLKNRKRPKIINRPTLGVWH
mmetsp:Transcript_35912/g.64225  ORF Transcript_35912/g.64225 Transcript_35912/m.64225 type:complete len:86 (+) Transcript_35912:2219-2476(+)